MFSGAVIWSSDSNSPCQRNVTWEDGPISKVKKVLFHIHKEVLVITSVKIFTFTSCKMTAS